MPDPIAVLMTLLVMFAPGAMLLWVLGAAGWIDRMLLPAAALAATVAVGGALLTGMLLAELAISWLTWSLALTVLASILAGALRRGLPGIPTAAAVTPGGLVVAVLGVVAALLGLSVGTTLGGDTFFHAGVGVKLMDLDEPSFGGMSRFLGGDPNPVYLLPIWHALVGVAATLAGAPWIDVFWMLPAIVVPTMMLAHAGLARHLFGNDRAAVLAALVYLCARALLSDSPRGIYYSSLPGFVTLEIILLLTASAFFAAVSAGRAAHRRGALVVLAIATVAVGMLHFNYLLYEAAIVGGYLVMWLLASPRRRDEVKRHLVAGAVCAVAALVTILPTAPAVLALERGPAAERMSDDRTWNPQVAIDGSVQEGSYSLQPRITVRGVSVVILGFVGAIAALVMIRARRMWMIGPWMAAVMLITGTSWLFPKIVDATSLSTFLRADRATPLVFGAVLALLWIGGLAERNWKHSLPGRLTALVALGTLGTALWVGSVRLRSVYVELLPPLASAAYWFAVAGAVVAAAAALARQRTGRKLPVLDEPPARLQVGWPAGLAVAVAVLVGSAPVVAVPFAAILVDLPDRKRSAFELNPLNRYEPQFIDAVRALPDESVVMANPQEAYRLMAVAPVYVVADSKTRVADSPGNRIPDRIAAVERFYAPATTDQERFAILEDEGVDAIVVDGKRDGAHTREFLESHPDRFELSSRPQTRLRLFRVRADAKPSSSPAPSSAGPPT